MGVKSVSYNIGGEQFDPVEEIETLWRLQTQSDNIIVTY